jgi:capsular polysaccharide biosynthesis protein/MinD-like ATPase involved in chromosome partitioning or flagellar assembly
MNETTDATAILAPIWRRKWLILAVAILVAAGTYFYYKRQPTHYQSTTQVYLAAGSEQQISEKGGRKSASANAGNQAALINTIVVESVHKRLRKEHNAIAKAAGKGKVKAKSAEKSEFVTITAEARKARSSALLANSVATAYIKRQRSNYEGGVKQAIAIARRQLRRLEAPRVTAGAAKGKGSAKANSSTTSVLQAANLSSKINQLEAQLAVNSVQQVKTAKPNGAVLLSPKPRKSAIFGFVIGLVLAAIAAFGLSRFNRRLRSLADIEAVLQTQILTALPKVKRPIVHRDGQPRPSKFLLEPLRRFHTSLQLGNMREHEHHRAPRSILFLSADAGDGKSMLAANLALVQREAGERTMVLEADFRRPVQARLLDVPAQQGLGQVLSGAVSVDDALQTVPSLQAPPPGGEASAAGGVATVVQSRSRGAVSVLVGEKGVPNPPVLLAGEAMSDLLRSGMEEFDRVLIDAPPPLEVSDVMPLLAAVDAIVIVARVGHTRETSAQRLQQLLMRTPSAPVLGVVANGAARADMRKYGISPGDYGSGWPAKLIGR